MPIDLNGLLSALVGGLIGIAGSLLAGRQSTKAGIHLALQERHFDVAREAYKAALAGFDIGNEIALREEPATPREAYDLVRAFFDPIFHCRIAFGLPLTAEMKGELVDSAFAVFYALGQHEDTTEASKRLGVVIFRNQTELTTAWQQVLRGGKKS